MNTASFQIFLTLSNGVLAGANYAQGNYDVAAFNLFVAGICFSAVVFTLKSKR